MAAAQKGDGGGGHPTAAKPQGAVGCNSSLVESSAASIIIAMSGRSSRGTMPCAPREEAGQGVGVVGRGCRLLVKRQAWGWGWGRGWKRRALMPAGQPLMRFPKGLPSQPCICPAEPSSPH